MIVSDKYGMLSLHLYPTVVGGQGRARNGQEWLAYLGLHYLIN